MKKSHSIAILLWSVLAVTALISNLQTANASHFRGGNFYVSQFRATDELGNPVPDGNYPATFSIYDRMTGGTVLWAETLIVIASDGLVSAYLGEVHPITRDISENANLYPDGRGSLEIVFNGEVISPRFELAGTPYAHISQRMAGDIETQPNWLRIGNDTSPLQTYCDMSTDGGGWTLVRAGTDSLLRMDTSGLKLSDEGITVGSPQAISFNGTDYLVVWESGGIDTAIHVNPNGIAIGPNAANGIAVGAPGGVAPNARLLQNALALRKGANNAARLLVAGGDRGELELFDLTEDVSLTFSTIAIKYDNPTEDKKAEISWTGDKMLYKIDGSDTAGISSTGGNLGLFVAPGKTLSVPATGGSVNIAAPATLASLSCPDVDLDGTLDLVTVLVSATSSDIYLDPASTFDCAGTATFAQPVLIGGGAPPPPESFLHVNGNITATGAKLFVQQHPHDVNQFIAFVALEGPEAGTYTRGSYQLNNGTAEIILPESFSLVTGEEGLTVQVTPRGRVEGMLYVERVSPSKLVVKASDASDSSVKFDYLVNGVRIGYEGFESIRTSATPNTGRNSELTFID